MKQLTILFDADDTIEDLLALWVSKLNETYGTTVRPEDIGQWDMTKNFPTLTEAQIFGVLDHDEVWAGLQPIVGAAEVLERLQQEGHRLYMVTATDYWHCKAKFGRILELFPFLDRHNLILAHNKQMIRGDILIDDGPRNLRGGDYFKILFTRPHNRRFDESSIGAVRVRTWEEVYEVITETFG